MLTIWPELAAALHPQDRPAPQAWSRCYQTKFALARLLQPKSIFEIGVRTGYSALAFLRAVPKARYLGIDANQNTHGGIEGGIQHARKLLAPYDAEIYELTSAECAASLNCGPVPLNFDLIHVDGDHSLAGCSFDLRLAQRIGFRHLLVDDYDGIKPVRSACDRFSKRYADALTHVVIHDGHNGAILFSK